MLTLYRQVIRKVFVNFNLQCSATCGEGMKKRDVICMKKLDGGLITVVGDENCSLKPKPPTTKPCKDLPDCQSEWFMTSWSKVR